MDVRESPTALYEASNGELQLTDQLRVPLHDALSDQWPGRHGHSIAVLLRKLAPLFEGAVAPSSITGTNIAIQANAMRAPEGGPRGGGGGGGVAVVVDSTVVRCPGARRHAWLACGRVAKACELRVLRALCLQSSPGGHRCPCYQGSATSRKAFPAPSEMRTPVAKSHPRWRTVVHRLSGVTEGN